MKFGRTSQVILGIGLFAIGFGSLYTIYLGQESEQEELNSNLSVAQATLPKLVSQKQDLESQLTQLESDLAEARTSLSNIKVGFPKSVESIEYDEVLVGIADECDLEIIKVTATEPADEEVESEPIDEEIESEPVDEEIETVTVTYAVTSFEVGVKGKVVDILDFVNAIATGDDFTTATAELVSISIPEPLTEAEKEELTEEEIEEAEMPIATIKIVIYSYKGE